MVLGVRLWRAPWVMLAPWQGRWVVGDARGDTGPPSWKANLPIGSSPLLQKSKPIGRVLQWIQPLRCP